MAEERCPVCDRKIERLSHQPSADASAYDCITCARFVLTGSARAQLVGVRSKGRETVALLSHAIRRMQRPNEPPRITTERLTDIIENTTLPRVAEQGNNLLLWIGDTFPSGTYTSQDRYAAVATIGARSVDEFCMVFEGLKKAGLLDGDILPDGGGSVSTRLSFAGWKAYERLKRRAASRRAFMVMPFDNARLDRVFNECLKPAVAATGFMLIRLDEQPRAGIIHDQLRNDIRLSRFLVVELTSNNCNAYWEAGYGEGLGKPVIYTCERAFFEKLPPYEKDGGTKFDTNHLTTVFWEDGKLADATERLKATIRVTLPAEAKLTD